MDREYERRRRRRRAVRQHDARNRRSRDDVRMRRRLIVMMTASALLSSTGIALTRDGVGPAFAGEPGDVDGCVAAMTWPLDEARVARGFDGPEQPWMAGHRGVDLEAGAGERILSPADGVVSFAGDVAGKQVVSIRHDGLVSSFEPAVTDLGAGAAVTRGAPFAQVADRSDHCDGVCLHWGVRRGGERYIDPEGMTTPRRIALKPYDR
ncbi:M23 family metallopeptidase [Bifidobacterium sp. CP2]|uniref:M23 family metallopeptidase n=1 Tax=Bifidobacterium sp. CP2 TaxID=2809025 RepID=UPI001F0A868A|nr:M23 family metallopeptidase [Bifidobacterium sp. CP2]